MKNKIRWWMAIIFIFISFVAKSDSNSNVCADAKIFSNIINDVCWSCFLPVRLMGAGKKPDGAADNQPACFCTDDLGVPEFGYQLGMWQPARLIEHTTIPWCSPSLGGIRLQDDLFSLGRGAQQKYKQGDIDTATYQYHYFSYPLFQMLQILYLPDCSGGYVDFDLMYMSEIDPTWNNDLLALLLSPEAIIFANPLAKAWCAADCVSITAGHAMEATYGCAGCDGSLYPFTGNVNFAEDPVRVTSLLSQRVLASLHRKGLAKKTMGNDAMCGSSFWPMIPKSQYKLSMIYPVPEASSTSTQSESQDKSKAEPEASSTSTQSESQDTQSESQDKSKACCHGLGESVHKWSTAAGGRSRPGKEDYIYMLWRYQDCCVLKSGVNGS